MAWVFYYHDLGFRENWEAEIEPLGLCVTVGVSFGIV